jgi:hypothetical protein
VSSPTVTYLDSPLTNGTTYFYKIKAVNAGGQSANSAEVSATPKPPAPAAPTGLVAVAGNAKASLTWTASAGATWYNIKRSLVSGGPYTTTSGPGSVTTASDTETSLANGTTYYYVVSAVNAGGESANSNEVSVIPEAPINGVCGTADQTYLYNVSSWGSNALCRAGTADPSTVAFPKPGTEVFWTCEGAFNGLDSSCKAQRNDRTIVKL